MTKNITVNGAPLAEYISEETGKEIRKVRAADLSQPKVARAKVSKHNGNHSHMRSGPVQIVYDPNQKAKKLIIRGTVYPWAEKGALGFIRSGESILGALECTADETQIKCHESECGEWFTKLGQHIRRTHKKDPRDYRVSHGLRISTSLVAPALKRKFSQLALARPRASVERLLRTRSNFKHPANNINETHTQECANLRMGCMMQLTVRITNMAARLGHCPSVRELWKGDEYGHISAKGIEWGFNMTFREALRSIGIVQRTDRRFNTIADPTRLQILQMRAKGHSYQEIANQLSISQSTAWRYDRKIDSNLATNAD